jgi:hypothetical protein
MEILKNLKAKISEKLTDSELFEDFEILIDNFYSINKSKSSLQKSILIYPQELDLGNYARVSQSYTVTGDLLLEIILNAENDNSNLASTLDDAVQAVLGTIELAKFTPSGTGQNKVFDGTCSLLDIKSVKFFYDSQAEGFTAKAAILLEFKAITKLTAATPTTTIEELNLELEESSYTDSLGRITTDEDLRIL